MAEGNGRTDVCILRVETEVDRLLITLTTERYLHRGLAATAAPTVRHYADPEQAIQAVADLVRSHVPSGPTDEVPPHLASAWPAWIDDLACISAGGERLSTDNDSVQMSRSNRLQRTSHMSKPRLEKGEAMKAGVDTSQRTTVHLFGGPYVSIDDARFSVPEGSKRLLAFVALRQGKVERRHVARALWPVGNDDRAAGNLRSALRRLRGAGIEVLRCDKWSLSLRDTVAVDVHQLTGWAERVIAGRNTVDDLDPLELDLDVRDLLPGWHDDWTIRERERLRQRWCTQWRRRAASCPRPDAMPTPSRPG